MSKPMAMELGHLDYRPVRYFRSHGVRPCNQTPELFEGRINGWMATTPSSGTACGRAAHAERTL